MNDYCHENMISKMMIIMIIDKPSPVFFVGTLSDVNVGLYWNIMESIPFINGDSIVQCGAPQL